MAPSGNDTSSNKSSEVKRVTIKDVAREAQVSVGTASRAINNQANVGREARSRVLSAAERLGYVPDAIAQSMRTYTSRAIGCMVSDVANPLFSQVVSAAEEVFHAAGYNIFLANSGDDPRREAEILASFKRRRLDGVIMTISSDLRPETIALITDCGLPVVLIERQTDKEIDSVASDHFGGTLQALDYLFMLNHRRIGLITVTTDALPGRARVAAFEHAFANRGLPLDRSLIHTSGFSVEYGFAAAQKLLTRPRPPTAIVAGANQMVGVLNAARVLRLQIPKELSIVSLGETDIAGLYSPPLTAVRWHSRVVGRSAAEILIARLSNSSGTHHACHIVLPTELIVRHSCISVDIEEPPL